MIILFFILTRVAYNEKYSLHNNKSKKKKLGEEILKKG